MAKQRDWVDYANLASNVYQNVQLSEVKDRLDSMASVAERQRSAADFQNWLREFVFEADTLLRDLRGDPPHEDQKVWTLATFKLTQLQGDGMSSARFHSFDDKEKYRSVLEGFRALVQECEPGLSGEEKSEARLCVRYLLEQRAFQELCQLQTAQEQLDKVQTELELAREKSRPSEGLQALYGFVGLTIIVISIVFFVRAVNDEHSTGVAPLVWPLCLFFIGGPLMRILAAKTGCVGIEDTKRLEQQRTTLLAQWPMLQPEFSEIKPLQQRFQVKTMSEVRKLQAEREALMARVLGSGEVHA